MSDLWRDVRIGVRALRRQAGFAALAVGTLGLGIGAAVAVVALVEGVLLKPLGYRAPEELVAVFRQEVERDALRNPTSPRDFAYWREHSESLEGMVAASYWLPTLTGTLTETQRAEQLTALKTSPGLFELLGIAPLLGAVFSGEEVAGSDRVTVLGYGIWQRRFGGDQEIVGRKITLDGEPYEVLGVMPEGFEFPPFWATGAELWVPLTFTPEQAASAAQYLRVFARLREGTPLDSAQAELDTIAAQLEVLYPEDNRGASIAVEALKEPAVGPARPALMALLGAVALLLLIAGVNVANLLLGRLITLRRDLSVRQALGSGRLALMRPLLIETGLLTATGSALGLVLARGLLSALARFEPESLPRLAGVSLDFRVFLFAVGVAVLLATALAGIASARAGRWELAATLRGSGGVDEAGESRLHSGLVVAQVTLVVVLLVGAGLLLTSFHHLQSLDPGFDRQGLLTAMISLEGTVHAEPERQHAFYENLRQTLEALPGVESAGLVNFLPIGGDIWQRTFQVEGRAPPTPGEEPRASFRVVSPGYLETAGTVLVHGRDITAADRSGAEGVLLVNRTLARQIFGDENPLGQRLRLGGADSQQPWRRIVGVVEDVRQWQLTDSVRPEVFLPLGQNPAAWYAQATVVLRTAGDPRHLVEPLRQAVGNLDSALPVSQLRTMEEILDASVSRPRLQGVLSATFAGLALALAAVGIYGVMVYSVGRRTRELGLRLALGALPGQVVALVLGRGLRVVLLGTVLGLAAAGLLAQLLRSQLYGVSPTSPGLYVIVALGVLAVAAMASLRPALRAAWIDPLKSLRES